MTDQLLPFDLEVLDAKGLSQGLSGGESLYITYSDGRYWLKSRTFGSLGGGADWDTHFRLTREQAREIIMLGYATWWINVDKSVR